MNKIAFSRRLYGEQGTALFAVFILGVLFQIVVNQSDSTPTRLLIAGFIVLFLLIGTFGWRWILLHRRTHRYISAYFAVMSVLLFSVFALETMTFGQAVAGNLGVLLILQSSVLPKQARLVFFIVFNLLFVLVTLPFLPLVNIIGAAAITVFFNGAVLLIGDLIVSEELARQQLAETNQKLLIYAQQAEALATMRERTRLAREIHDNFGHYLTIVNVQSEVAQSTLQSDPANAILALEHIQQLTKAGLQQLRQSVGWLRTTAEEEDPLHDAIAQLVAEHQDAGFATNYQVAGQPRPLSADMHLALYRVVQEGLTNIRKHAQARNTLVLLQYDGDQYVRLRIQDDGKGSSDQLEGFGLVGIRERLDVLGGKVKIESTPDQGFCLLVEVRT